MPASPHDKPAQAHGPRGKFLSVLIVANASALLLATAGLLFSRDLRGVLGFLPGWFDPFLVVLLLARLIALGLIWNLRRSGVVLYLLLECLEVAMGLFVFTSVFTFPFRSILALPSFFVLLIIWFLALRSKWQEFT
jgi:hypothetical protein